MRKPKIIVRESSQHSYTVNNGYAEIRQRDENVTFIDLAGKKRTRKSWSYGFDYYVKDGDKFLKLSKDDVDGVRTVIDVYVEKRY